VLAGVDKQSFELVSVLLKFLHQWGGFHEIWSGPDHANDLARHHIFLLRVPVNRCV